MRLICRAAARDSYHAHEYLCEIAALIFGKDSALGKRRIVRWKEMLFQDRVAGVVEAGCKSVIGKRAKQSGMFWSTQGAEDVLFMRTALSSNRFDAYWDQKHAA